MTQISILSGIYSDLAGNLRVSYPVNLEPMLVDNGLSKGYLRSAPGIIPIANGPGADRGAIVWNGVCYRVMGDQLVSVIAGVTTLLGSVGDDGKPVSMDYGFDRMVISSNGNMFYFMEGTVSQVTDANLGTSIDSLWVDGYYMSTDGISIVVTDLNDPYTVDPDAYGSSEADPDPIVGLTKVRDEIYAVNRYTIENFQNVGVTGNDTFPFQRNASGLVPKGAVGTHASAYFLETFAFVGSGRNEALSVYLAGPGESINISTPEVDRQLAALSDADQAAIEVEARIEQAEQLLYVHLPNRSLVYKRQASVAIGSPVWYVVAGGVDADQPYPARHLALIGGQWICGSSTGQIGYLSETVQTQYGDLVGTRFDTAFQYNAGRNFIVRVLELVGLTGQAPIGLSPTCFLSFTTNGQLWGQERAVSMGESGQRSKRVQWRPRQKLRNYCGMRFRTANAALTTWARLEADIEALS